MECKKEANLSYCNCSYSCNRKGACCDCLQYHRKIGELPACYFPQDVEATGNRSIENFIRLYQQRGSWW